MDSGNNDKPWFLKSSFPVDFPTHEALTASRADFEAFVARELERHQRDKAEGCASQDDTVTDKSQTLGDRSDSSSALTDSTTIQVHTMQLDDPTDLDSDTARTATNESPFMQGLLAHGQDSPDMTNRMFTENHDVAYRSTGDALVDLFDELEDLISGPRLRELLEASWQLDPLMTLKIIFNARSIHLGKSSRRTFYRAAGWLAHNHPLTLIANLRWLTRPVVEKKMKKVQGEEDAVFVESGKPDDDDSKYEVKYGLAHGYWKDLPNLLALAVNNSLDVLSEPKHVLNPENPGMSRGKVAKGARGKLFRKHGLRARVEKKPKGKKGEQKSEEAKEAERKRARDEQRDGRHEAAVKAFNENPFYRALHLTIARLFADQLTADLEALRGDNAAARRGISLCGKWAPSSKNFHDRHTFLVSSIAEIMYPRSSFDESLLARTDSRETYLRWARERYRQDVSSLRKHHEVVERRLTAKSYDGINYETVPSLAMNMYTPVFIERDFDRFDKYIDKVAVGNAQISGATLLPSTLIRKIRDSPGDGGASAARGIQSRRGLVDLKKRQLEGRVCDGQWNTLVRRIKDSGTLSSCMAVCDVSGSMSSPRFGDGTTPMDSSIGLSLLMAEVVEPPFGGAFITFHSHPDVVSVDLNKSLRTKYQLMQASKWGANTDLVAVFERLVLPMAIKNKVKPEDMVKRIFVFSDMHFDEAAPRTPRHTRTSERAAPAWSSSYERIKALYGKAGYEMPELVFWNLAGGRAGAAATDGKGDPTAPKPALADEPGVSMVSGYSQGMLKVFMDGGGFDGEDEEEDEEEEEAVIVSKEGREVTATEEKREKKKMDALATVKKAIGHKAYDMLKVLD